MQLPSVERTPTARPAGSDVASSGANRVIPVAPVNPSVAASAPLEPTPGVINHVNPALQGAVPGKPNEGAPVYTSVTDPLKNGANAKQVPHDWTIHRPAPEAKTTPPAKSVSQVLMEQIKTIWTASANAVQLHQVKNQLTPPTPPSVNQPNGDVAKQALIYQPSKIKGPGAL